MAKFLRNLRSADLLYKNGMTAYQRDSDYWTVQEYDDRFIFSKSTKNKPKVHLKAELKDWRVETLDENN